MSLISTERLKLVPLSSSLHYGAMRRMNGDARAMRYIWGRAETPAETRAWLQRAAERWRTQGHSWWAVMHDHDVIGAATLQHLEAQVDQPFEIGWRLPRACEHHGYATEAARGILEHARSIGIDTVYAVADPLNLGSRKVMERIGMRELGIEIHYQRKVATYRWSST